MKKIITILAFIVYSCVSAQFYTLPQIVSIDSSGSASEGDLYLDTITNKYYIGLTNGKLAKLLPFTEEEFCDFLKPFISPSNALLCDKMFPSSTYDVIISGHNFSPTSAVQIAGQTINSLTYINPSQISVNVTTNASFGNYDIIVENLCGADTLEGGFMVQDNSWLDLRAGGNVFSDGNGAGNDIRYRAGMGITRNANGMRFTGSNPWNSWVKFEGEQFARDSCKTVEWVFRIDGAMMLGISGLTTNEGSGSQWQEGAVMAYFDGATSHWGYYGSEPTNGNTWALNDNVTFANGAILKVKIESDGSNGANLTLYQLPSANQADWDNETTILNTTISTNNNTQSPLVPFIIPRNSANCFFVAMRVY